MSSFSIHWSIVQTEFATPDADSGFRLLALWPAPVSHDACFRDAGFTEFADNDDTWAARADDLLIRLLSELAKHGEPHLVSEPIEHAAPWFLRPLRRVRRVGLREQITLPMQWDSLPDCVVAFGASGVTLRTGNGHHIFWLALPRGGTLELQAFLRCVAGDEPLFQTTLQWKHLL